MQTTAVYLLTNEDAPNFKFVRIDMRQPDATMERDRWEMLIPEEENDGLPLLTSILVKLEQ